jgi:hypothetical protein
LKAGKDFVNDDAYQDLVRRGFIPVPVGDSQFDILSNEGEATVRMKDGVEYVMRFGKVAGIETAPEEDEKKTAAEKSDGKKDAKADAKGDAAKIETAKADENSPDHKDSDKQDADKKEKGTGLSRYIMVMAQFNPELLAKPELDPLPEIKKAPEKPAADKKSDAKKGDTKAGDKTGTAAKGEKADAKGKADAKDAKSDTTKPADAKTDAAATEEDQEAIEAERDRIEKENKRKQDAYDEKVKAGQQKAKELNARFADWYYVVNDETYRKIHLGKAEIVKKKADDSKNGKDPSAGNAPKNPFEGLNGLRNN